MKTKCCIPDTQKITQKGKQKFIKMKKVKKKFKTREKCKKIILISFLHNNYLLSTKSTL